MKYTDSIEAEVIVTVRWPVGQPLQARASAVCEYQPGSTASAEVGLPDPTVKSIHAALSAALPTIEAELGKKLAHAKHEAVRIGAAMGEKPSTGPARGAGVSGAVKARRS